MLLTWAYFLSEKQQLEKQFAEGGERIDLILNKFSKQEGIPLSVK